MKLKLKCFVDGWIYLKEATKYEKTAFLWFKFKTNKNYNDENTQNMGNKNHQMEWFKRKQQINKTKQKTPDNALKTIL